MTDVYPYGQINGVGVIAEDAGASIPDHYLIPMSKTAIDIYVGKLSTNWKNTAFYTPCKSDWDGEALPCTLAMLDIERYNLYFVNKIITYTQLLSAYNEAAKAIEGIPHIPSLKEQFRDIGKIVISIYAGFKSAGPVGFFQGAAAGINQILANERMRRADKIQRLLNPMLDEVQQAEVLRQRQEDLAKLKILAIWGGGALAVTGIVWWVFTE